MERGAVRAVGVVPSGPVAPPPTIANGPPVIAPPRVGPLQALGGGARVLAVPPAPEAATKVVLKGVCFGPRVGDPLLAARPLTAAAEAPRKGVQAPTFVGLGP